MLTSRENIVLFICALIAVVLITITASLQLSIWSDQRLSTDVDGPSRGSVIHLATATSAPITGSQASLALASTQDQATPIPTVTLSTAVLSPAAPEPIHSSADASNIVPVASFTSIPIPEAADLRLGYIRRAGVDCGFFTQVMELILEREAGLAVHVVEFRDVDEFYAALASTKQSRPIDLTLCFTDPDDRPYIQKYFGYTKLIGSAYWHDDNKRLQIIANASVVVPIKKNRPCLYNLLQNLNMGDFTYGNQSADQWLAENVQLIQSWNKCDLKAETKIWRNEGMRG